MITGNYTLVANPEWRNVQSAEVFLQCDTTLADVNITLPALSALGGFWNVKINILNALGANKVSIIGFTQVSPLVANKVNGVASVTLATLGDSTIVSVEDANNWISTATSTGIPSSVATLAKSALATATYTAKPVGTVLAVVNYATSGDGMTIVKTTLANNTFADWMIIATENPATTNHIGQTPK
jgi:hypothetical protein